nr:protein ptst, chloroplastic [Quercus suber]
MCFHSWATRERKLHYDREIRIMVGVNLRPWPKTTSLKRVALHELHQVSLPLLLIKTLTPLIPSNSTPSSTLPQPASNKLTVFLKLKLQTLYFEELFKMEIGTARCCLDKQVSWFSRNLRTLGWENIDKLPYNVAAWKLRMGYPRLMYLHQSSMGKHPMTHVFWRRYSIPVCLEESSSLKSKNYSSNADATDSPENLLAQPLSRDELKLLLADSERTRLVRKLSEANQQNRFLKRQLHVKEDALVNFKSELAVLELEVQWKFSSSAWC